MGADEQRTRAPESSSMRSVWKVEYAARSFLPFISRPGVLWSTLWHSCVNCTDMRIALVSICTVFLAFRPRLSFWVLAVNPSCNSNNGGDGAYSKYGDTCYKFVAESRDGISSRNACRELNGTLVTVYKPSIQFFLEYELRIRGWSRVWIGATQTETDWHWVSDGTQLQFQGCYFNDEVFTSKWSVVDSDRTYTPAKCVNECTQSGWLYAAVHMANETGSVTCRCGDTRQQTRPVDNCEMVACPSNDIVSCGSWHHVLVFNVGGLPLPLWRAQKPGNESTAGIQKCLVLNREFGWRDKNCDGYDDNRYGYICQFEKKIFECESGGGTFRWNKCYKAYESNNNLHWFAAREMCVINGGELLTIDSRQLFSDILSTRPVVLSEINWWIGATRWKWTWSNGNELGYTNWASREPSQMWSCDCVVIDNSRERSFQWSCIDCGEKYPYICELDSYIPVGDTTTSSVRATSTGNMTNLNDTTRAPPTSNDTTISVTQINNTTALASSQELFELSTGSIIATAMATVSVLIAFFRTCHYCIASVRIETRSEKLAKNGDRKTGAVTEVDTLAKKEDRADIVVEVDTFAKKLDRKTGTVNEVDTLSKKGDGTDTAADVDTLAKKGDRKTDTMTQVEKPYTNDMH